MTLARQLAGQGGMAVVVMLLAMGGAVYVQGLRSEVADLREDLRSSRLATDSVEAVADSTREVLVGWQDSTRFWQRRAVQTGLERDSLDEALAQESRARAALQVTVRTYRDSLRATQGVTEDRAGTRRATFRRYREPFQLDARVVVPPPPDTASMTFGIRMDPIPLTLRIGCALDSGRDVVPANITLGTPPWAEARLEDVVQDDEVCNPIPPEPHRPSFLDEAQVWAGRLALVGGALYILLN